MIHINHLAFSPQDWNGYAPHMTEEPATAADGAGKKHEESFWASFNRADMKLFLLTFAGTVAANVVTVMVVAVAIILAQPPKGERPTTLLLFSLTLVAGGIFFMGVGTILFRRMHKISRMIMAEVFLVCTVGMGLCTLEFLLILLGFAVKVK